MAITIDDAKAHCRVSWGDDDVEILGMIETAKLAAEEFMDRRIYEAEDSLDRAIGNLAAYHQNAVVMRDAAMSAAAYVSNHDARAYQVNLAVNRFDGVIANYRMVAQGVVENAAMRSAMLLMIGHLYDNRKAVITGAGQQAMAVPMSFEWLLQPYRCGMGV